MAFSGPQDHYITKDTFIQAYNDNVRLGTIAWESFLGSLSNDPNSGYYGTSFDRPSISGTPGYIVNYLFASGLIDGPTLDQIITNNGGDPNGYYAGIINSNPITQKSYNWHKAREFNIEYCEENGCRDPAMQRFYDKWKASGQPTTKDGMWSDQQYDEWLSSPANTLIPGVDDKGKQNSSWENIRNGLIQEGYDPDLVDHLINGKLGEDGVFYPGAKYDTTTQGAAILENMLENVTGKDWDILQLPTESAESYSIDTDGDGVYDTVVIRRGTGEYSQVYGADVDPNDPTVIGQIQDLQRNVDIYEDAVNSEGWDELEDWEKNAVLRDNGYDYNRDGWFGDGPDDYSEFGLCSDNYTVKKDAEGSNCSDFLTEEEKLVRDYGQEAVDKAKEIYNGIEDWVEGTIEDPLGALKNILDTVYSGMPEECKESNTNKPDDWWKDCTNLSVLGQIPGLPIPLPPGTIDVNTTIRDLEDAAKEAGKTLEDIFNPTCTGTPAEIQECENRTISDIIGDWASDVWDDIKGAWEDLEDKTEEGLLNILIDSGYNILSGWILTQVKDAVSTDNPLAFVPLENCVDQAWLEQASPEQKALCNNVVNCEEQGLTGGWVRDIGECVDPDPNDCAGQDKALKSDGTCGECLDTSKKDFGQGCVAVCEYDESLPEDSPDCKEPWTDQGETAEECASQGRLHVPGDASTETNSSCGDCLTGQKDFGQGCVAVCEYDKSLPADSPDCKEPWTDKGPTEQQCTAEGRLHVPGDAATETDSSCGDCLPTHTDEDGTCKEWTDGGPTEEDCTDQNKVYRPSTGTGRDSSCGGCADGYELINGKCEEEGFEPPCPGKQVRNEETRECEDPITFVPGDPCTTEDGKAGTFDSEGVCVPDWVNPGPTVQDCEALGKTHVSGDPSAQKPSECGGCKNSTWNPIGANGECVAPVKCWDDSTAATESECPEEPRIECWDGEIVNDESKCSEEPRIECWDGEIVNDKSKCSQEPPKVNCASQNKIQETPYECGGCLPNFELDPNSQECVAPKECKEGNEDTTVTEEITIPYGVVVRGKPPTYEDNGTQCVKTTYTYVNEDPTAAQCEEVGKVLGKDGKTCVDPPPCVNNAVDPGTCEDCGADNTTPSQHEDGDCKKPLIVNPDNCGPDTFTQERTVEVSVGAGEPQEPTTQYVVYDGACTKLTTVYVQGPSGPPPEPPPGPNICADGIPPVENNGECVECPEGSQYPNASSLAACGAPPKECNAETATKTINLTETIPFGDPLPDPTTTYEDDGTQCVATTTTYVEGPNPCATIDDSNYDECGYDKCEEGSESPYVKDGLECIASVIKCTDPNRNTNEDESCADGCKEGYRLQPGEGGETLCLPPQTVCWNDTLAFTESECPEEPPKVDCASQNKIQETPYECGGCLPDFKLEGNECVAPPKECNAETATEQVNLTETIPFGDPLPDPTTTYEDNGTQCVATTTTYVEGPNPCGGVIDDGNYKDCGYVKCEAGSESPYVKVGLECIASVIECTDPNRKTNEDGSCADECKDGFRLQPGEGGETLCLPPQFPCWDNTLAFTEAECDEEPPKVNCADANRKQVDAYTCGTCLADYKEGEEGCVPKTCEDNGQTTSPIDGKCVDCSGEITHKNFNHCGYKNCGDSVYIRQDEECVGTGLCDDGLEAVSSEGCHVCADNTPNAGKSVSSPEACGEPTTVDPECVDDAPRDARGNCPEDYCPDGVTLKDSPGGCPEIVGPNECDEDNLTPQNAEGCGKQLCNGEYIDINLPCVTLPPPEGCEDPTETDFGKGAGCEKPCPDNANIGISDALCGETPVTTCLDNTATNFNQDGPCEYGPVNPKCENGAIDPPLCSECADGSLPDADRGCDVDDPCDDSVYAAENPEECTSGPNCVDCDCPAYAAANPEECIDTPPPPPPPEGGGGGGSGEQGEIEPIEFGISGDPELLDRMQFPITDYLSGLFTGNR